MSGGELHSGTRKGRRKWLWDGDGGNGGDAEIPFQVLVKLVGFLQAPTTLLALSQAPGAIHGETLTLGHCGAAYAMIW
jgi:hypothetical protein